MKRGDDPSRKRERDGRYAIEQPCDACGKPVRGEHFTDEEVVGGSDAPGFFLCSRVRCSKERSAMTVEQRRAFYQRR